METPDSPYSRYCEEELILRDHLAAERTVLANERTALAYLRTMLTFLIGGATFIQFFDLLLIEVLGYGIARLHAPVGLGVAGVAAALLFDRAFEHGDARAVLLRRHRRRQAGDAAADDDQVEFVCLRRVRHCRPPRFFRHSSAGGRAARTQPQLERAGLAGPKAYLMGANGTNSYREEGI